MTNVSRRRFLLTLGGAGLAGAITWPILPLTGSLPVLRLGPELDQIYQVTMEFYAKCMADQVLAKTVFWERLQSRQPTRLSGGDVWTNAPSG